MNQPLESTKTPEINPNGPEDTTLESVSISVLPDNCLMSIFDHVGNMEDLQTIRTVCVRWKELVEINMKRIKNAICYSDQNQFPSFLPLLYGIARRTVYIKMKAYRCIPSHLMPNLEIIDVSYINISSTVSENTEKVVGRFLEPIITQNPKKIIGLSLPCGAEKLLKHFSNLSIFSLNSYGTFESVLELINKPKLKQLYCNIPLEELSPHAEFENLEILITWISDLDEYAGLQRSHGTLFTNLKTLIIEDINFTLEDDETCALDLGDISPELRNVFLGVYWEYFGILSFSKRNLSVQTFVLNFSPYPWGPDSPYDKDLNEIWNELIKMLDLHPNIKHLAILSEYNLYLSDARLLKLLELLPDLVLLKLSYGDPTSVIRVISEFNSETGRSIKFMRDKEMDSMCTEFTTEKNNDFMRKYFFGSVRKNQPGFTSIIA